MLMEKLRVLWRIFESEEGQAMVEYSLILGLIVLAAFGALSGVADAVADMYYNRIWPAIENALGI